jgi:hypothetical protein
VNANRTLRWSAVLVCAVSMASAPGAAQNRTQPVPIERALALQLGLTL